jgi:DNA-binding Lrp family transcriptional regulator
MLDPKDRALIRATQNGLPLVERPYLDLASQLGESEDEVIARLARLLRQGAIRRIGAIPNHYALGFTANGMSVWNVADDHVQRIGTMFGSRARVTHCYRRPRHGAAWPYNLFAMVHGRTRADVSVEVAAMAQMAGEALRAHDILYSTRLLKKTGLRLAA